MCIILHYSSHFFLPFFPRSQRYDESKANRLIQNIKVTPTPLNTKNTSKTQILRSQPYHVPSNPRNPPLPPAAEHKIKNLKISNFHALPESRNSRHPSPLPRREHTRSFQKKSKILRSRYALKQKKRQPIQSYNNRYIITYIYIYIYIYMGCIP